MCALAGWLVGVLTRREAAAPLTLRPRLPQSDALAEAEEGGQRQRGRRRNGGRGSGRGRRSGSKGRRGDGAGGGAARGSSVRSSFDFKLDGDPNDSRKFDVDELVKNFEDGTHLQELRRALDDSQRSLSQSDKFIQKAASSWFG